MLSLHRARRAAAATLLALATSAFAQPAPHPAPTAARKGDLRVLFADVEGGQATLFVTPAGESLLIDTGWPGNNGRDADRILELAHRAGITRIDDLLITHFHVDHAGGVPNLVARIPVVRVFDHGDNTEFNDPNTVSAWTNYTATLREHNIPRHTVEIGRLLPLGHPGGVRVEVVSSNGGVLETPLPGAGKDNPACATSPLKALENSENDKSVGIVLTFGQGAHQTRLLDLGDLTWGAERNLVCPVDKLGPMAVYVVSHHGFDRSGSPALIAAIHPRLAIMDNGPHKGGAPSTLESLQSPTSVVEALWQLHASEDVQHALNTAQDRMANRAGEDGHFLELDIHPNGSMSVFNSRTAEVTNYPAR